MRQRRYTGQNGRVSETERVRDNVTTMRRHKTLCQHTHTLSATNTLHTQTIHCVRTAFPNTRIQQFPSHSVLCTLHNFRYLFHSHSFVFCLDDPSLAVASTSGLTRNTPPCTLLPNFKFRETSAGKAAASPPPSGLCSVPWRVFPGVVRRCGWPLLWPLLSPPAVPLRRSLDPSRRPSTRSRRPSRPAPCRVIRAGVREKWCPACPGTPRP